MHQPPDDVEISKEENLDTTARSGEAGTAMSITALSPTVAIAIAATAIVFFACSSLRHALFQSTGFDLGIYDQVTYLIGQGLPPISSILGFHHLGNHAAWAVYPLALLYKIYADVHWLLWVQAIALALAAWPTWSLARLAGWNQPQAAAIAGSYLLYPVIFNANWFDFHPEVMAVPAILGAILAARLHQPLWFTLAIIWILGCKAVLSFTVIAIGAWLLLFEKRRLCGAIALILGIAWFLIATQKVIPFFSGSEAAGVQRYSYLGHSVLEVIKNVLLKPQLTLGRLLSFDTLKYLFLLILPLIWGLLPLRKKPFDLRYLQPLICALPTLTINSLSDITFQRSLAYHYSLPVIPFLLLAVIAREAKREEKTERIKLPNLPFLLPDFRVPKTVIAWSLLLLLLLGEQKDLLLYATRLDTWQATRQALSQVQPQGSVLTDNRLAPHLTHRPDLKLLSQISPQTDLAEFKYIILNLRHPWPDTQQVGVNTADRLRKMPQFQLSYEQNEVVLFTRNGD